MTTWQSCDCYLLPVNGPFLCLISFTYGFTPLSFFSLFFYFPVYFSILAFSSFFAFFLFHSLLLFFLFIGKTSLEPADYPRVLGYKITHPRSAMPNGGAFFCIQRIYLFNFSIISTISFTVLTFTMSSSGIDTP